MIIWFFNIQLTYCPRTIASYSAINASFSIGNESRICQPFMKAVYVSQTRLPVAHFKAIDLHLLIQTRKSSRKNKINYIKIQDL